MTAVDGPRTPTVDEFTAALEAVVADAGPDHVYSDADCVYIDGQGNGACLIGRALLRLGYSAERLARFDYEWNSGARTVLTELGFPAELAVSASEAQLAQDSGLSWGRALARYHAEIRLAADPDAES